MCVASEQQLFLEIDQDVYCVTKNIILIIMIFDYKSLLKINPWTIKNI